jgi:hypothetical protein
MVPIADIIEGLNRIPSATWIGEDPPWRKPDLSGGRETIFRVAEATVLDDTNYHIENNERWREFKTTLAGRVTPPPDRGKLPAPSGIDAIAWYCSFHSFKEAEWGIYVPLSSIPFLDETYFSNLKIPRSKRWKMIWNLIVFHELAHFYLDRAIAWFELIHHVPLRRIQNSRMQRYANHTVHSGANYIASEEEMANGFALRQLKLSGRTKDQLFDFVRMQPMGYRDGIGASTDQGFREAVRETIRAYLVGYSSVWNLDLANPAVDLNLLMPTDAHLGEECPIRVINDLDQTGLNPDSVRAFCNVAPIAETKKFLKQLDRMHDDHAEAWRRLKDALQTSIPAKADFKKWADPNVWSIRVNKGIRAHLQWQMDAKEWRAQEIGQHKEMGHG